MVELIVIGHMGADLPYVHPIVQNIKNEIILVGLEKEPIGVENLKEKHFVITRLPDVIISEIVYDLRKEVFLKLKNSFISVQNKIKICVFSKSLLLLVYERYRHPP